MIFAGLKTPPCKNSKITAHSAAQTVKKIQQRSAMLKKQAAASNVDGAFRSP